MDVSDSGEEYDSSDLSEKEGHDQVKQPYKEQEEESLSSDSDDEEEQELSNTGEVEPGVDKEETEELSAQVTHSPISDDDNQTRENESETKDGETNDSLLESTEVTPDDEQSKEKAVDEDDELNEELEGNTAGSKVLEDSDVEEDSHVIEPQEQLRDSDNEDLEVFADNGTDKEEVSKKRKRVLSSDSEDSTSQAEQTGGAALEEDSSTAKKRKLEDDEDSVTGEGRVSDEGSNIDQEDEQQISDLQEEVADLAAVAEVGGAQQQEEEEPDSEDEGTTDNRQEFSGLSDWDVMMARRKEAMARTRRKRRKDIDITASDDYIMNLISKMRMTAEQDRQLNLARKPATKKLQILPTLLASLKKSDLQTAFIECGILSAMAEWLTPLPDHSLPHLKIRDGLLDVLKTFPVLDASLLKSSKIGKAVMLLYKHPKESRRNRERAGKIVNEWARPIFGLASDFKSLSRDEREKRDYSNLSQAARRRLSSGERERRPSQDDDLVPQKPGDKGWIGRARVPMPSTNDYVVRPKWNVEQDFKKESSKKVLNRYEKHLRKQKQQKMQGKSTHAASLSIEGRHMPL